MALFVDQFDAIYAASAAGGSAYFVHELEQHGRVDVHRGAQARLNTEMQNDETFLRQSHEDRNPERSPRVGYGKQSLNTVDVPHSDTQGTLLFMDLGYAVGLDGLLNAEPYPMLVHVEKEQMLQRDPLVRRQ
jgi:hypothetical protein